MEEEKRTNKDLWHFGKNVNRLAKDILGKKGFLGIELIAEWHKIVGVELAQNSVPQGFTFKKESKTGGTLIIAVTNGAFALEINAKQPIILEKINTYFGYNAVSNLKIVQNAENIAKTADNQAEKPQKELKAQDKDFIQNAVKGIQNENLKSTLIKLGEDIFKQ